MNQNEKARYFSSLHVAGSPCLLYNVWDAGGAQAVEKAGARAIATGSWSIAAAHGFEDGEAASLDFVEKIVERICASVSLPVTVDFESGYAEAPEDVAKNARRIIESGAVGINFEDQIIGRSGLFDTAAQSDRIAAIRESANEAGIDLFINARTDLFLQAAADHPLAELIDAAKQRADAYENAGASGFFAPGLIEEGAIGELCQHVGLPVNVMMMDGAPTLARLRELAVSRVSYGPLPFLSFMDTFRGQAETIYSNAAHGR